MKQTIYYVRKKSGVKKLILDIEIGDTVLHKVDATELLEKFTEIIDTVLLLPISIENKEFDRMKILLNTSLESLNIPIRTCNILRIGKVTKLGQLAKLDVSDLIKFRDMNKKSLTEFDELLSSNGLEFSMDVSKYGF
jgi:DNA-directed RNA polymerase subunit alpha